MGPIGFFDSGVGGISVLQYAAKVLPHEDFFYFGDSKNAPYGQKSEEEILRLTCEGVDFLLQKNIKALVIACNTATSAAAKHLRETLSIPVIGMEPALKPAHELRKNGQIIVLATQATLRQEKFRILMEKYGDHALCVPGSGIVELVENGIFDGPEMEKLLHNILDEPLKTPTDALVLGCTHFPFAANAISRVAGESVTILDSAVGTVNQLKRVLAREGLLSDENRQGNVMLYSSLDDAAHRALMQKLLHTPLTPHPGKAML